MPAPEQNDLIDRVNDEDEVIGTVTRGAVFAEHAGFRVAHVLVLNHQGQVLLQRTAPTRLRSPDRWGSSVAAYLHAGESPLDGARRRLQEELGLATPVQFCGRPLMHDETASKFIYVYITHAETASIQDPTHIQELKFWDPGLLDLLMKEDRDAFTETLPYVLRAARPDSYR